MAFRPLLCRSLSKSSESGLSALQRRVTPLRSHAVFSVFLLTLRFCQHGVGSHPRRPPIARAANHRWPRLRARDRVRIAAEGGTDRRSRHEPAPAVWTNCALRTLRRGRSIIRNPMGHSACGSPYRWRSIVGAAGSGPRRAAAGRPPPRVVVGCAWPAGARLTPRRSLQPRCGPTPPAGALPLRGPVAMVAAGLQGGAQGSPAYRAERPTERSATLRT